MDRERFLGFLAVSCPLLDYREVQGWRISGSWDVASCLFIDSCLVVRLQVVHVSGGIRTYCGSTMLRFSSQVDQRWHMKASELASSFSAVEEMSIIRSRDRESRWTASLGHSRPCYPPTMYNEITLHKSLYKVTEYTHEKGHWEIVPVYESVVHVKY